MHLFYALFYAATFARPLLSSPTRALHPRDLTYAPIDGQASCGARALLTYLQKQYGASYISGQQEAGEVSWVKQNIGRTPALQGNDFIDYSPSRVEHGAVSHAVEDAQAHDAAGGINAFVWHWNAPTDLYNTASEEWWSGFYTAATSFNVQTALAEGPDGADYKLILRDIDAIAVEIKRLSDSNIPILFRPLHEPDGGWFWWGAHGSAPFLQLWDILYDRIVNYHNLHNLLWVCNTPKADWYPGNDKCDIATTDIYANAGDHSPQTSAYSTLQSLTGGARVLALAEVGEIPDPEQQHSSNTPWAYWMTWSGTYIEGGTYNSKSFLETVYNDKYVVTLDGSNALQGWRCGSEGSSSSGLPSASTLAPTPVNSGTTASNSSATVAAAAESGAGYNKKVAELSLHMSSSNRTLSTTAATGTVALSASSSDSDECDAGREATSESSQTATLSVYAAPTQNPINESTSGSPASSSALASASALVLSSAPASSPARASSLAPASSSAPSQPAASADSSGYILPMNGTASTTQFQLGPELSGGTACGMDALPSGNAGSSPGTGPGFLYAALNQLAFGANPAAGAGGAGGACGLCFDLTPVSAAGTALTAQKTTFMIIDECPVTAPNSANCGQCSATDVNSFGQTFHFDIAADAMSQAQYDTFYAGVTDGSNWKEVHFTQVSCSAAANTRPSVKSWGCIEDCKNNDAAKVCAS